MGIDWLTALPAYFRCLADGPAAEEYARQVDSAIKDVDYQRPKLLTAARRVGNAEQEAALRRLPVPGRRCAEPARGSFRRAVRGLGYPLLSCARAGPKPGRSTTPWSTAAALALSRAGRSKDHPIFRSRRAPPCLIRVSPALDAVVEALL